MAYGGIIGRAENQEMVRLLRIRMSRVRHLAWGNYRYFALVDTQPRTGNNQLPDRIVPDIVVDHHPVRAVTRKARFYDVRPEYGASATIVAEYLREAGVDVGRNLATALLYAIRTETQDFRRGYVESDQRLYDELLPRVDRRALAKIQAPRLPLSYFETLHDGLEALESVGTLIVTHLGHVEQPDIVPEVADLLIRMEGKTWSLCTGIHDDRMYLSLRTSNTRADAGRLMRRLIGSRGKGGGHGMGRRWLGTARRRAGSRRVGPSPPGQKAGSVSEEEPGPPAADRAGRRERRLLSCRSAELPVNRRAAPPAAGARCGSGLAPARRREAPG